MKCKHCGAELDVLGKTSSGGTLYACPGCKRHQETGVCNRCGGKLEKQGMRSKINITWICCRLEYSLSHELCEECTRAFEKFMKMESACFKAEKKNKPPPPPPPPIRTTDGRISKINSRLYKI